MTTTMATVTRNIAASAFGGGGLGGPEVAVGGEAEIPILELVVFEGALHEGAPAAVGFGEPIVAKIEAGEYAADTVRYLVERGIPVMAHVGLQPQQVHTLGGYRYQGRTDEEVATILRDALAVESAGAFCVVFEGIAETLAAEMTKKLSIPTIGIGASSACDGQVLVAEDMLGLTTSGYVPSFVKTYANLAPQISAAAENYAKEVRARIFPGPEHTYGKKS